MNKNWLLASAALAALCAITPARADTAAATSTAMADGGSVEEVVVYGQGETRQTQSVPHEDIAAAAPGTISSHSRPLVYHQAVSGV